MILMSVTGTLFSALAQVDESLGLLPAILINDLPGMLMRGKLLLRVHGFIGIFIFIQREAKTVWVFCVLTCPLVCPGKRIDRLITVFFAKLVSSRCIT